MQTKNRGILLFTKVYKENDLFIKFLSNTDEINTGIVYGGLSKKKRNIYQVGYFLDFQISFKHNKPNSISAELSQPYISNIINDKYKINCLLCVTSLISLSIIEGQKVKNIFSTVEVFLLNMFSKKKWFIDYCIFLFQLLKIIGYEIDLTDSKKNMYFDLEKLQFKKESNQNTLKFPYELLDVNNYKKIKKISVNQMFNIFETVFLRQHLSNFNLHLPNQYHLFKKLIIEKIN